MDRQHRKELKHDRFVDEVGSLTSRARENQRILTIITASVVVIALIAYGVYFYRSTQERKAQEALATAIATIDSPLIQPGQPNPDAKFHTVAERSTAAEAAFKDVQSKFSGSDAADVADLYLARLAADRNDTATAQNLLQHFITEHPKHMLVGSARYSLYRLRIGNGDAARVATELNGELARSANQVLPPDALLDLLAQAYDASGNSQQSKDTYRRIITQFPDSPYALDAQRKVGSPT